MLVRCRAGGVPGDAVGRRAPRDAHSRLWTFSHQVNDLA
ncbi:hypothetical protein SERN_1579 [Serinibacter arcticus]|uniref:Uncharacterized protein n=1 Tax=Serinibacter arcticus TaxID=1655435 RepID=A0A4Z1E0U1_9MICO|nr:hypothetical protein SERN_1579 [Serinibacter arcticus]